MFNESQIRTLKIVLGCLVVFSVFFINGLKDKPLELQLETTHIPFVSWIEDTSSITKAEALEDFQPVVLNPEEMGLLHHDEDSILNDSIQINIPSDSSNKDSIVAIAQAPAVDLYRFTPKDQLLFSGDSTIRERILLVGDSQVECVRNALYNYTLHNQHKLVGAVTWYGSVTLDWGYSDTLNHYIQKWQPTTIIYVIGLNEIFVKPGEDRKREFKNVIERIESYGLKYCIMGPAAWTKDMGIVQAMADIAGKHFFDGSKMDLARADDGRHPSLAGGYTWFEAAAEYMTEHLDIDFSNKIKGKKYFEKNSPLFVIKNKRFKKSDAKATAPAVATKTENTELPSSKNTTITLPAMENGMVNTANSIHKNTKKTNEHVDLGKETNKAILQEVKEENPLGASPNK